MHIRVRRRLFPLAVALGLGACIDFTGLDIAGGHLISIWVDQGGVVEVGDTLRLTASGNVDGLLGIWSYDPILDARWAVSDPAIAQVVPLPPPPKGDSFPTARTLIRGLRPGAVHVSATARGVRGEAIVRVFPVVATIQMRATRDTLTVGDTVLVTAAALDATGVPLDGVPLRFDVDAGAQFASQDSVSARIVATSAGLVTVTARFRRTRAKIALVVVPRAP